MRRMKLLPLVLVLCSLVATAPAQPGSDQAIADYTKAIRLSPEDATAWYNRGVAWLAKKEFDKAILDFNRAIRLEPKYALAYYKRGNAWREKKEFDKAIADYTEAIRRDPKDAGSHNNRGIAWREKKDFDKAIADYTEAIQIDPKIAAAYNNRGESWSNKKEYDKAIYDYNEAIRLVPNFGMALSNRGAAWSHKKEYGKAISDYSEASRIDPKDANTWNASAWFAATCPDARYRNGKNAVEHATRACELTAWKDGAMLDTLAAAYAEAGDFPNAVKWAEKAVELAPKEMKGELRSHLDVFKAHKPYREEVTK